MVSRDDSQAGADLLQGCQTLSDTALELIPQPNRGYQDQILLYFSPRLRGLKLLVGVVEVVELIAVEVAVGNGESLLALTGNLLCNDSLEVLPTLLTTALKLVGLVAGVELLCAQRNKILWRTLDDNADHLPLLLLWKAVGDSHSFAISAERDHCPQLVGPLSPNED